jgi:lipoprotein signal peptidase
MVTNEAGWDRALRVIVGVALLAMVVVGPQSWWGLVGLAPLLTGALGYCPLYQLVGLSTCPVKR